VSAPDELEDRDVDGSVQATTALVYPAVMGIMLAAQAVDPAPAGLLDNLGKVASILEALAAVVAAAAGGIWAYYRFLRERTYRPRFDLQIQTRPEPVGQRPGLHFHVAVKNIGVTKIGILQKGTGLRVTPSAAQPAEYAELGWDDAPGRVHKVLEHHRWIEPGETIHEELLVAASPDDHHWRVELRILCEYKPKNIAVYTARIVPPFQEPASAADPAEGANA
jgi:hypothetical protein